MRGLIAQLLASYCETEGVTKVDLPPGLVLHPGIEVLILLGFLLPLSTEWRWSWGTVSFRMTKEKFEELKISAEKHKICFVHT